MKQYMIVKVISEHLDKALEVLPIAGLSSREAAEQAVVRLKDDDPGAMYLIQEVGMAYLRLSSSYRCSRGRESAPVHLLRGY
jgi:hypothetical protein